MIKANSRKITSSVKESVKPWIVSYLPTPRSRKPRQRMGYGNTEEEAMNYVREDNLAYNSVCHTYGAPEEKMSIILGAEPYIAPWKTSAK